MTATRRASRARWLVLAMLVGLAISDVAPFMSASSWAAPSDVPVRIRDRTWTLRNGPSFVYGRSGDTQLMGDWDGDGVVTPGVFRAGTWYLRDEPSGGAAHVVFAFGRKGDIPVVGDWNGDGRTTVGYVRGTSWRLRNRNAAGIADIQFRYGRRGDVPVTGDWDADGRTGIGVVRGNTWYLRNGLSTGAAQVRFAYGRAGDVPVTGDWDGDGVTTAGVVRGGTWHLRNQLAGGPADRTFTFGLCGDAPLSTTGARTTPGVPTSLRGTEWSRLPTTQKVVALTFDAGANADGLPSILATLEATGTPATFFLTGTWSARYPALARQVASRHTVGNHTRTHPDLTTRTDAQVRAEIADAHLQTRTLTGRDPRPWFRFPFGARDARTIGLANCLNYGSVRWTVDTLGWTGTSGGQSTGTVTGRVLDSLRPGAIVLMHVGSHPQDGSTLDADALPGLIKAIEARGYRFVDLDAYR